MVNSCNTFFRNDLHIFVPDDRHRCWFTESSVFVCSSLKDDPFLMYPLAVLSHLHPRFAYILGHDGHARSQGGHQPAAAQSPSYTNIILFYFISILFTRSCIVFGLLSRSLPSPGRSSDSQASLSPPRYGSRLSLFSPEGFSPFFLRRLASNCVCAYPR